jgi:hypothetical protein
VFENRSPPAGVLGEQTDTTEHKPGDYKEQRLDHNSQHMPEEQLSPCVRAMRASVRYMQSGNLGRGHCGRKAFLDKWTVTAFEQSAGATDASRA